MSVAAVIVAAGRGIRFDPSRKKQYVELDGLPIVSRSIEGFMRAGVDRVWVVLPGETAGEDAAKLNLESYVNYAGHVAGSERRQDSVWAGLCALPEDVEIVAIHDAVRPLTFPGDIKQAIERAKAMGAAILATPVIDTVKRADDEGRIAETLDREQLWLAQTPQVFRRELIERAYRKVIEDGFEVTDEAAAVERLGEPVSIVPSQRPNPKITVPEDLAYAEWLLTREGGQ